MGTFASIARDVADTVASRTHTAAVDKDAEWQRVNSYIADVLKDTHVLYAKLARLQGDFGGKELSLVEKVSEGVLDLGKKLSAFSKAFYEGKASMVSQEVYGENGSFGGGGGADFDFGGQQEQDFDFGGGGDFGEQDEAAEMDFEMPEGESQAEAGQPDQEASQGGGEVDVTFDYEEEKPEPKKSKKSKKSKE